MAGTAGLLAEWDFNEGQGQTVHDASGNGHDGKVFGADWVKQGDGYVLSLDGLDDYVDCGRIGITGPVTIEAWVRPMRKAYGEACLLGESMSSYLLTYYNTEVCGWYIGHGAVANSVQGKLSLGEWNHLVATFDGKTMGFWVNGRLTGDRESRVKSYQTEGRLLMATRGRPDLPHFKGMLGRTRVYNRALSGQEVVSDFKGEAARYGFDTTWFNRVKVVPYYYFDRGEVLVQADFRGLQPLEGGGRIEVTLANRERPQEVLQRRLLDGLPGTGVAELTLPCRGLADGAYILRVSLQDDKGPRPVEERIFSYPQKPLSVTSPDTKVTSPLPAEPKPASFGFRMAKGGGFELTIKGHRYPFESRISWPKGDFNRLTAADQTDSKGENSWKVVVQTPALHRYTVDAAGNCYKINRDIRKYPTHVYVKDTYTNTTSQDLGLLIYNEMLVGSGQVTESRLSGHERWGRQAELSYPDYNPNVFLTDANTGMGIVPIDDVYIVQGVPYVLENTAGVCTEKFALAPGKSYTLEWAVYPTGSKDYYDFVNTFRKVEGRSSTIEGAPGYITYGPLSRRQVPTRDFVEKRGLKVGIISGLGEPVDDPLVSIEGIEFTDFPKEMQLLKEQASAIHKQNPGLKVVFHIAHSLYSTDRPDRFADSKVIYANGKQATWGTGDYFGKKHDAEGWRYWIFYPTPGNSFHTAMLKSVDVLMDQMGFQGGFMDGFMTAYCGQWTYDGRWDGHSAEIDLATKTIKRKMASVILLSQPSLIEFARKIRDKGGVVISNNTVVTRSIAKEKYLLFDNECASGPELHMLPNVTALSTPTCRTEQEVYLDMLDKLSWGELWVSYAEPWEVFSNLTHYTLASKEFPMTFEEIRSGLVRGKERIVTMNSGVYGWPDDRCLHAIYKFDDRGAPVPHGCITTTDKAGVRTELPLGKHESAVIEKIPVTLESAAAVNTRVVGCSIEGLRVLLNGRGPASLRIRPGAFSVKTGSPCGVSVGGSKTTLTAKDDTLVVPLKLNGLVEVVVVPTQRRLTVRSTPIANVGIMGTPSGATNFSANLSDSSKAILIAQPRAGDNSDSSGGGFIATQGAGRGDDMTRIYDRSGRLVKRLDHAGRTMVFDDVGNLFVGDSAPSGGKYPIWRYPYQGDATWGPAEKYCEVEGTPRALAFDADSGILYIGLDDAHLSNVYRCARQGDGPALFCGVNSGSRQIQDLEVGPDGKVWIGMYASGYMRYPLSGGFKPEMTIDNRGRASGLAFGPDRNGDGKPELYASVNGSLTEIGYYDYETGAQLGTLFTDEAAGNYCLTFGPDRNGDGIEDIYIAAYDDKTRVYDGRTGAKLGEMAEGLPNGYLSGWVPQPYKFVHWTLDGVKQPEGQTMIAFNINKASAAVAKYEAITQRRQE